MTLFDLAKKNIMHNFIHYFLYFASIIFAIMIYYTFISLSKDPAVNTQINKSEKLSILFDASSIILIIFVFIFILYSNQFFIRKRKKEIGIYSLLGLRKKEIGRMLFYENFLMSLGALIIGIALGIFMSKLFVAILLSMMDISGVGNFVVSIDAITNTMIVFLIITLITSFNGCRIIYHTTLLELFQSEGQAEKKPKNNFFSILLSVVLIAIGYILALQTVILGNLSFELRSLIILVSVIVGTVLLVRNFLPYLLGRIRKNKQIFYNGTNIISNSQLLFRIASNARTLTIIAILSATTLTAIGTISSLYYNAYISTKITYPSTFEYHILDSRSNKQALSLAQNNEETPMTGNLSTVVNYVKATSDREMPPEYFSESGFSVINQSQYNKLLKLEDSNMQRANLKDDEAIFVAPADALYTKKELDILDGQTFILQNEGNQKVTLKKTIKESPFNTIYGLLILSDDTASTIHSAEKTIVQSIMTESPKNAVELSEQIQKVLPEAAMFASFPQNYEVLISSMGVLLFIGMFIGLVFLTATGSIIYFKQLTEAYNDTPMYNILKQIGLERKQIRETIAKQVLVVFIVPLILGIAHSSVALVALSNMMHMNLTLPVIMTSGMYILIFFVYYFLTVNTYTNIVAGKN